MAACEQPCLAWSLICAPPPESPRQRRRRDDDDARQAAQVAQARRSANARQSAPFARDAAFEAFDAQARFAATTPTTPPSLQGFTTCTSTAYHEVTCTRSQLSNTSKAYHDGGPRGDAEGGLYGDLKRKSGLGDVAESSDSEAS